MTTISVANELVTEPTWIRGTIHYETIMGSRAYGVANDQSDYDIYGWCLPPKGVLFPWLDGYIPGLDKQIPEFGQVRFSNEQYDINIYSLLKYMRLVADNNPNMLDSLFTPEHCVLYISKLGKMLRDKRHVFLSKAAYHSFRGYAHSQLHKVDKPKDSKEFEIYGYDVDSAYHTVRLMLECEQILAEGDLTLDKNSQVLRDVREGLWSLVDFKTFVEKKMDVLKYLCEISTLPERPDEKQIKQLFLDIIEEHYGKVLNDAACDA